MVQIPTRLTDAAALAEAITGQVHDQWIDLDEIAFDQNERLVSIPLRKSKRGTVTQTMRIRSVDELIIHDSERIGSYDVSHVTIDPGDSVLAIHGNIPLRIDIHVSMPAGISLE